MKILSCKVFYITAIFFAVSTVYAHGSLTIRIENLTNKIIQNPKNATLYFERGFLYQQHLEYKKAIKDFLKSNKLNFNSKELQFRLAESYYLNKNYKKALKVTNVYLDVNGIDVKIVKLQAQILFQLKEYDKSLLAYSYVINNMVDLRPEDFIEYTNIILTIDCKNYSEALAAIDVGLSKLGENTLTLQLKKLEYLKASNQPNKVINQYNYFILNNQRKEFWYYKKAKYLAEINKTLASNIAIQQSKTAITILKPKIQNTLAIKNLITKINKLENQIAYD